MERSAAVPPLAQARRQRCTDRTTFGYTYDAASTTTRRTEGTNDLKLTWDPTGDLIKTEDTATGDAHFVYDADGERLVRRDNTGSTLYLPGMELHLSNGTTTAPVLVHNTKGDCDGVRWGVGKNKAPKATSKKNEDGGIYKDRETAVRKAKEMVAKHSTARFREECAADACHVHVDISNNRGEVLYTWHYQWHRPRGN
ncbi:hypothetical protein [Actinomadura fibrosa]|uniref:RHS repeat protein n=1 Tax=Actinomadura fibrosa TaxID=111802 RepID=A0ABW2XRH1_9ACTN|nr:hypothetical protein [Actinomadura fibrosa]